MKRGYFGVGIYQTKTEANVGTLYRTARLYGAAFVFTVGHRYQMQVTDTPKTPLHTPLFHFDTIDDLVERMPSRASLIGVELDPRGRSLPGYGHPDQAVYLLGAEDRGLPKDVIDRCHSLIEIPSVEPESMNVAVAGSIVIYDRRVKRTGK